MVTYKWNFLDLFAKDQQLIGVKYLLTADDGKNSVSTEGNHTFSDGIVNKQLADIVESNLTQWIDEDTTIDDVNPIKCNLENQLNNLSIAEQSAIVKVDFPWLAGTFTI